MEFELNLPIHSITHKDASELIEQTNILIVTVNSTEKDAFLRYLLPIPQKKYIAKITHKKTQYYIGRLGFYLVAHVQSEAGSTGRDGAILTVKDALDLINPKAVIMVGVAFGINPQKQKIGDVLVSKKIISYEAARINSSKETSEYNITPRGDNPLSGRLLYNSFTNSIDWKHYLKKGIKSSVIGGDLLSGEKLIDDLRYRTFLSKQFPKSIGGEMEGTGVSSACLHNDLNEWIIVKGICDWADGKKHKGFQPKAAHSANSLLFHVCSDQNVFNDLNLFKYPITTLQKEKEKYCVNARKGSPLWTLNKIRSCVLTMLLKDLKTAQKDGYNIDICNAIKSDLNKLYDQILKLPNLYEGSLQLSDNFDNFITCFNKWSGVTGSSNSAEMMRIKFRNDMKRYRTAISRVIRLTQKSLSYNMEEINQAKLVGYQQELISTYGDVFPNLKKAVSKLRR